MKFDFSNYAMKVLDKLDSNTALALHEVIDQLDEIQLDALYKVALCFASQNGFDDFTPEESDIINRAFDDIRRGNCKSFSSAEAVVTHFNISQL